MNQTDAPVPPFPPQEPQTQGELRKWTVILNLVPLVGLVVPFGHLVAPLVVWLVKKQDLPALDGPGKANLNYQISWTIWGLVAAGLAVVGSCLILPLALPLVVLVAWIIITILSAIKASNGEPFQFPLSLEFLK